MASIIISISNKSIIMYLCILQLDYYSNITYHIGYADHSRPLSLLLVQQIPQWCMGTSKAIVSSSN